MTAAGSTEPWALRRSHDDQQTDMHASSRWTFTQSQRGSRAQMLRAVRQGARPTRTMGIGIVPPSAEVAGFVSLGMPIDGCGRLQLRIHDDVLRSPSGREHEVRLELS